MAVTPASLSSLSSEEQALVSRVETSIDSELRLKYETGKPVHVRNALIREALDANPRVKEALQALYVSAGWVITSYSNDEGEWWSFYAS